jgi:cytochrome c oxidase cbb3-type subunit 2
MANGNLYSKPVLFTVVATVTILAGSIAMMAYPLLRPDMQQKVAGLAPLGALELAGRDVYQRESCNACHTQTVRPLRSEIVRYKGSRAEVPAARYSLAGEFAYDHPFLWGSKRTGPDLAFEGWVKPARDWHHAHFENPQGLVPRSNMPAYAFLKKEPLDGAVVQAHMRALRKVGVPYTDGDIAGAPAAVAGKTAMDALVAYTVSLGKAVDRGRKPSSIDLAEANPLAADREAAKRGRRLFEDNGCAACHGEEGEGVEGVAPSLVDDTFLEVAGDMPDAAYGAMITFGSDAKAALGRPGKADGGMPPAELADDDVWAVVSWLRAQKRHEAADHPAGRKE